MALMPSKSPKVIVIGAGPIGLYTSMVLANVGCDVSLVDDGKRGAGWASGGMLGAAYEILGAKDVPDDYKTFAFGSQWLWGQFLKSIDVPVVPGSLFLARTDDEVAHLVGLADALAARDLPIASCAVPTGLNAQQAWLATRDIAFNPRQMLSFLRVECRSAGVSIVQGRATQIKTGAVTLDDDSALHADQIIVTTGYAGQSLAHCLPELSYMVPVKGQMLAVAADPKRRIPMPLFPKDKSLVCRAPDTVMRAGRVYLIPRGNTIVIGATSNPADCDETMLDKYAHAALFQEAVALYPSLAHCQIVESWAGLRPMTPDGLPLLGSSRMDGVILATGMYRNGWLLAAGIANHVMGLVLGDSKTTANLQCLSPLRFPI
jgi:glycine oxidase